MSLFTLDWVLWAAGFASAIALFSILVYRRRWREFPCFTIFAGQSAFSAAAMYGIYHLGYPSWYARAYYSFGFLDEALQLAVVWEIVRIVLRPTGTWVQDAKRYFLLGGGVGILLAAALSWMVSPPTSNPFEIVGVRIGVFNGTLICELFLLVVLTSNRLGLGWRNHIMSLIVGWSAWAAVAVTVEGLHSYFGAQNHYRDLEHARMIVFQASLGYWMVQFWLEEPARRPIPPELASYIANLHNRVKNNLDTVGAQR
jgi:hypothetical protein